MALINKFIQFVLAVSVVLLVYAMTLTGAFSSTQRLSSVLEQSGFYDSLAKGLSAQLSNQIIAPAGLDSQIKTAIAASVTPEVVKTILQPSQIAAVEWLNQSGGNLEVSFDLENLKKKATDKAENPQAKFELTKLFPDVIVVVDSKNNDQAITQGIVRFKQAYQATKTAIPVLWGVALASALLLFILNLAGGSKKITRISYGLVSASIIGLALSLLAKLVASGINLKLADSKSILDASLITKLIVVVISQTFMVFVVIATAALLAIVLAKIVFRGRDKKLKKK